MNKTPCLASLPPPPPGKSGWPWTVEVPHISSTMPCGTPWPRVSIVTPSFNQAVYLEETIRSVLLQGYPNLEYWVMDGGSCDQSVEIIQRYTPWLAGWVSETDSGQAEAINKGWLRSTGDFLGWINSDDVLLPSAILNSIEFFQTHPEVGFIYGDLEHIGQSGEFIRIQTYQEFDVVELIRDCRWISQPGSLFRRLVLDDAGFLDPSLHFLMDFDFWIKAGFITQFGYLRIPLARFREHEDAKTSQKTYLAAQEIEIIYSRIYLRKNLPDELVCVRKRALSSSAWYSANNFYLANWFGNAFWKLLEAVWFHPLFFLQREFYVFALKLLFASLVGGTKSLSYQRFRSFCLCAWKGEPQ